MTSFWQKFFFISLISLALPSSVFAETQAFTFTKTGPTIVMGPIIARAHTYDSAPTAIEEDNVIKVWYCGGGAVGDPYHGHDSIYYASYNATTGAPITQPTRVVWVTLNDAFDDGDHACAVTVVKHQNPYIANFSGVQGASQYKMWYECAPRTYRKDNGQLQSSFTQICHAVSDDGLTWRKFELLSPTNFRFNPQSTAVLNNPVNATAVITLSQGIKDNLQLDRRSDGKLYANFGAGTGGSDLGANYGVGHPTAITLPPDANGFQRIQLWYYDSSGAWGNRTVMRVESGDGFHFEAPVKTNLQSPKTKYVNVPVGGHPGFYVSTAGPFYLNVFNYSWDGINWFWGDGGGRYDFGASAWPDGESYSFYATYLGKNFNLGSVTGCTVGSGAMVGDKYGRIQSLTNIKFLSTEGGFGKNDNHKPGDQCYNADEDNDRGNSMDIYTMTGNLNYVGTTTPTTIPGDLNSDGHVDRVDYNLLVAGFGTQYTIFDYNNIVTGYGK